MEYFEQFGPPQNVIRPSPNGKRHLAYLKRILAPSKTSRWIRPCTHEPQGRVGHNGRRKACSRRDATRCRLLLHRHLDVNGNVFRCVE